MKSFPIILLVVATALAVPLPNNQEAVPPVEELKCTNSRFLVNTIYQYKYEAFSFTNVDGTSEKGTGLRYRCDVQASVPEPCKLVVNVDNCALRYLDDIKEQTKLSRHEVSKEFEDAMSKYDIIAHIDDGIVKRVLAHADEATYILNIKRGLLNMISLNFEEGSEELVESRTPCVSGNCTQLRRVVERRDGEETDVEVTRDLRQCENRPISGLWTSPLIFNVTLWDKAITSNQTCTYELEWNAINRVKCSEFHTLWPFSYDSTRGIKMEVFQDLKYSGKDKVNSLTIIDEESRRVTDLIFEHEEEEKVTDPTYANEIMKKMVKGSLEEIQMETPQLFSQFVGAIRKMNNESIHEMYERAVNCPLYYESCQNNEVKVSLIKTFTYDALIQCGTLECFRVINTAIISGEVSKPLADFVLYTMALRDYPELTLIEETLRVAFYNRTQSTFLPLSIMINNYWNRNEEALRSERQLPEEIRQSISFLSSIIGYDCSMPSNAIDGGETVENQRQIYLALKAIGNIGQPALHYDSSLYLVDEMMSTRLLKCAQNKDIPRNISLAAVQAMRRFEITQEIRDPLKTILMNADEDVELRLVSYLMIMRSKPQEIDVAEIVNMLREEPIDQVRAFVYSHLDNILESDLMSAQELKDKITSALPGDFPEYPRDIRRLSRNIEFSQVLNISQFDGIIRYLNETFNSTIFNSTIGQLLNVNKTIGGGIEMNTMQNPETYMMRAAMLKTTLNLLGKEWEMIETGIDMQGFEPTLEALFGPQGFFPDNILSSMINVIDEKFIQILRDLYNTIEPHMTEVYNTPVAEMPDILSTKAKDTTDYLYDTYNTISTKQKRSITDSLTDRINELTNLLPGSIHENIQTMHETVSKLPLSPAASVYLRLLGHEVGFVTLDDVVQMMPKVNLTTDGLMQMAMKMIKKAQNGMEYNITKSFVFMDKEFILPTSIGLPVRCNVNGTTSVSLRLRAQAGLQLPKIFVAGRIAPSGAVNFVGAMTTELPGLTKHAVVANATIYHASRLEGNITIDGTHIKFNLNNTTPINLLNFSTNFYLQNLDGQMTYIPGVQQDRVEKELCVPESLTQPIFGMTPCVSWAYPNASYAEKAPRFPLTGPSSFNVTLRNIDPELRAFTWEAYYKQVKPSAPKTTMMKRRRRSTTEPKVNIIDTVVFKFSAPGKNNKREIGSMASFDRSKTEFRYNFSIPETNTTFFTGILNRTCSKSKVSGFQFVTNFTALRPEYNASVSLTLMNSTVTDKSNYTAVYNMSMMDLYSSAVAEYVHTPTFVIASTNVTYYWDNETPLWRQLVMWPLNNYTIDQAKYRQDYAMMKLVKRETARNVVWDNIIQLSVMQQNITVKSDVVTDDIYYTNDIKVNFENFYNTLNIINVTVETEQRDTKQYMKVSTQRFGHGVFVQIDGKQDSTDTNYTLTYGYEGDKKEILESFKVFENQPSIMDWFQDDAYTVQHISYNISHVLCVRDESIPNSVSQRLVYFNTSMPKVITDGRLNFSLSARVANESVRADNNRSYWMEFNTSVPFLWFHNAQKLQFVDGIEGMDLCYNNTMTELFTNRNIIFKDCVKYLWKTMNATWEVDINSCYFNYTFNTTMYNSTESGYIFDYSYVQNNTLMTLFNITHGGNFSIAPRNISLIGAFWHPWMQVNMTNVLHKHGPITRFSLANIRAISEDLQNKTQILDVTGITNVVMGLINNTLDSSFNLTNMITVRTPWLGNFTLDHATHFNFSLINHTMNVELIRPRSNVGFLLNTSALLNRTGLSGAYNASLIGNRFYNGTSNMSLAVRKADEMALAVDFMNNHGFVTPFGKMNMNGTYNIHNMTRPWRFNVINGTLGYDVSTRLVNSTMNSSFIMDNFTHFFKFDGIRADLDHNITSPWMKWLANGSFIIDDFRNLVNYSRINGSLNTNFTSWMANMTNNVNMEVKNMSGIFRFEKIGGNITQNVSTIFGNSNFKTGIDLENVTTPWNFTKVKGSMDYNLTSRLVNSVFKTGIDLENVTTPWNFTKVKGSMDYNLTSSLFNSVFDSGFYLENVTTPWNFTKVKGKLDYNLTSSLVNLTMGNMLKFKNFTNLWEFEKIKGLMIWSLNTSLANATLKHGIDFDNFITPINFDRVNVTLEHEFNSGLTNVSLKQAYGIYGMRSYLTMERANTSIKGEVKTPWINSSMAHVMDVQDMSGPFNMSIANISFAAGTANRFLNFTTTNGMEWNNMRGIFTFDRINGSHNLNISSPLGIVNTFGELIFNEFTNLTNFQMINATGLVSATSRMFNFSSRVGHEMHNFRSMFDFDRVETNERTLVRNCFFNHTGETRLTFDAFRSLFNFDSIIGNLDAKTSTFLGEHNQTYVFDLRNTRQMFDFDRLFADAQINTKSRWFNMTATHNVDLNAFQKLFTFNSASLTSNVDIKTPLLNTTNTVSLLDNDHREMFTFNRIFGTHRWIVDTPIHSYLTNSDIELLHFYEMFKFTHLRVNNEMELINRFVNFTSNHKYHMDNFLNITNFEQISTGGTTELTTILGNHNSNIDITFNQFRSLLNFDSIKGLGQSHFVSRYLNDSIVLRSGVTNHRALFDYDRFDGSYNMVFLTGLYNLTQNAGFGVDMMRNLFNFDRISTGASMNMTTPIVSAGSRAGIDFTDFRSLLNYKCINTSAAMNLTSTWLNVTSEATHGVHEMSRMFVFERMNTTGILNISTPIITSNTTLGLDMFNFTKLWRFTRVNGSALWNVTSGWLNITNEGMFGLHNVSTPWRFERINGTAKMNVSTPIVGTTGMAGVEFNNFTNLFNFSRVNGTGNMNVTNRFLNFTTGGDFGLHNFTSIFTFDRINGTAKMNLSTPLFVQSGDVALEMNNFTKLWVFRGINGTGNWNFTNRFLNVTTGGDFGFHNFDWFTTFERINGSMMMNVSTPILTQASRVGIEFTDFTNLTNFRRINATANMTLASRFLNTTSQAEFGVHDMQGLVTFERINGSIGMKVNTPIVQQASKVGIEFTGFTNLTNFRRINATANMTVDSRFLNVTSQGEFGVYDMQGLIAFDRINTSVVVNVTTPLANVSVITGSEHTKFLSLFNFERVNYNHTVGIRSKMANFTSAGVLGFYDLTSFSVYPLIDGFLKMNFTSKYMNVSTYNAFEDKNHTAFFEFERFNVTSLFNMTSPFHRFTTNTTFGMRNGKFILDYDEVVLNMTTEFITGLVNVTTNSSIALCEVRSLFNISKLNTTFVANITTPVASTKLNASLLFDNVTSWRLHNINGSLVFLFRSPMLNTSALAQMNMTNFLTFSQIVQVDNRLRVMEREAGLVLTEKVNNDFVLLNATVPEIGSLCALAELNQVGDLLNMSIFRQTSENVNITDLNWILMLNSSDVVYSNFTWNPETLRALTGLSGQAFNKTINVTLAALNMTRQVVNTTLTLATRAINSTIQAVNYTYNYPLDAVKIVINGSLVDATIFYAIQTLNTTMFYINQTVSTTILYANQTLNATIFYVNQTWYLMDFTSINSTVESFVEAIKQTPLNVPIQFVNETLMRMDFTSINSTIESILFEINVPLVNTTVVTAMKYLNNSVEIIGVALNETVVFLNTTSTKAIVYFSQKLNETIVFLNETWRDGNFTTVSATIDTLITALNRTLNATVNTLLSTINSTYLNTTVFIVTDKLNDTIVFLNEIWRDSNFTTINATIDTMISTLNRTLNATVNTMISTLNVTLDTLMTTLNSTYLNTTVKITTQKLNETIVFLNEIWRDSNFTSVNATIDTLISTLNRTLNATVNTLMSTLNVTLDTLMYTLNSTYLNTTVKITTQKLNDTIVFLNEIWRDSNFTSVNATINTLISTLNRTLNATVNTLLSTLNVTLDTLMYTLNNTVLNTTVTVVTQKLNETMVFLNEIWRDSNFTTVNATINTLISTLKRTPLNTTLAFLNETWQTADFRTLNATINTVITTLNRTLNATVNTLLSTLNVTVDTMISTLNSTYLNTTVTFLNEIWRDSNFTTLNATIDTLISTLNRTRLNTTLAFLNETWRDANFTTLNATINTVISTLNRTLNATINTVISTLNRTRLNTTITFLNEIWIDSNFTTINATIDTLIMALNRTRLNTTLAFLNETWRDANFTTLNATIDTIISTLNRTRLNTTILFINNTWQQMDFTSLNSTLESLKEVINMTVFNDMLDKVNFTYVSEILDMVANFTYVNEILDMVNLTYLSEMVNLSYWTEMVNLTYWSEMVNLTYWNETVMNYTNFVIDEIQRIAMNESHPINQFTIKYLNTTAYNLTMDVYTIVMNTTEEYYPLVRNLTLHYYELGWNLTESVYPTVYNLTITYYPYVVNYTMIAFDTTMNYTLVAWDLTEDYREALYNYTMMYGEVLYNTSMIYGGVLYDYSLIYGEVLYDYSMIYGEVLYGFSLTYGEVLYDYSLIYGEILYDYSLIYGEVLYDMSLIYGDVLYDYSLIYGEVLYNTTWIVFDHTVNYTDQALNMTMHYGLVAFNKTRNYTLWFVNVTKPHRDLAYNFTLNMTNLALNKAVNYSLAVIEYTANKTEWAKMNHREYIIYYMEMLNNVTNQTFGLSTEVLNTTLTQGINLIETYGMPMVEMAVERSKDPKDMINILPLRYFEKTLYVLVTELRENVTRKALEMVLDDTHPLNVYLLKITDMNAIDFGTFAQTKALEYQEYLLGNVTYFANVTRSNVTYWTNYTLETAPMVTLNLIGNVTLKANDTVLWLNSTRSQSLNVTLEQVKKYLNETVIEVVEFLNKTLNGSTERLLNMTWAGYNMTLDYANRTLIFVNETAYYVTNTTIRVWRFINEETPLVNMTIEFATKLANQTLNFTLTYANKAWNVTLVYAQKGTNVSLIAFDYLKNQTLAVKNYTETTLKNLDLEYVYFLTNFTKNVTQWSLNYTKDTARLGVEYVNGTMVGWFIRYYELQYIPYSLYNITYTHVNNTPEYLRQLVEFNKRLTVDTINKIGRLEDNSFAINISHPLNFTSFRKFPNFTNDQWEMINNVTETVYIYGCMARDYVDVLREIAEERYTMAKDYVTEIYEREMPRIDERINQLKTKYEELKVKVQELREQIPEYRETIMEKYETYKQQLQDTVTEIKEQIPTWEEIKGQVPTWEEIKAMPAMIQEEIDAIIAKLPETYVEIRSQIIALPDKYLELKTKINAWIETLEFDIPTECQKLVDRTVEYPTVHTTIQDICNKIPELKLEAEKKLEDVQLYIQTAREYVEEKLDLVCETRPTECEQIKQYWGTVEEYWQTVSEIDAPYVKQTLEEYIPATWDDAKMEATDQWELLKQKIEDLIAETGVKIDELKIKVEDLTDEVIVMSNELQEYVMEIRDLIMMEYPNYRAHLSNAIEQVLNMIEGTYSEIRKNLVNFIETNYPTLKMYVNEIVNDILAYIIGLQPVLDKEASAMIMGNFGILTFDKKLYEFPGYRDPSCTYVLARDFVDRNFTLLADQNSITAVLPTVVVKIDEDHRVYINGVPTFTELPYQTADREVQVVRDGPWINITTEYGITVNCHEKNFLCTMKLSSWYHGKTQGLLGTFDREIDNEMRKIDNTNATTIFEWINNYEVTGHAVCQIPPGRNVLPTISGICQVSTTEKISICENLFMSPESVFADAFNVIDNAPFLEFCTNVAEACLDVCDVAHGYASVSRDEGVMIQNAPVCDRCENDIELNDKFNLTKIPQNTADIVLVVSENQINNASPRYIEDLVAKVDKTLRKASIENNRYSLVAFGGEGVHKEAHLHTSEAKVFVTKDELTSGIDELVFAGAYQTDAMSALEYANNLHWRVEASRIVILITEEERMEPFNSTLTYQDMTTKLEDNSVRLFIFSEYETLNKDGIEPVLGINYDSTVVTIKKTSADSSFKLKLPKGDYAKIATATKGAMFRVNMLMSNTIDRSEFNAQISKVLRNSIEQEFNSIHYKACVCTLDLYMSPYTKCTTIRK